MLLRHIHADLPGARHDVRLDSPADVPTRGAHAADRARGRSHCQRTSCAAARRGAADAASLQDRFPGPDDPVGLFQPDRGAETRTPRGWIPEGVNLFIEYRWAEGD